MDSYYSRRYESSNTDKSAPEKRKVLLKTYATLMFITALSGFGVVLNLYFLHFTRFVSSFLAFITLIIFSVQKVSNVSQKVKLFTISLFALLEGMSISFLIGFVYKLDPKIIYLTFFCSTIIFGCFTAAAIIGRDNWLYIGGTLSSIITLFVLYGGLVLFCFYVLYDTQKILQKIERGGEDYCDFAVELFLDFVNIFIRILIILARNAKKKKKDED